MRFHSRRRWSYLAILSFITLSVAIGISACSDDDDVTAPRRGFVVTDEQSGVYTITMVMRNPDGEFMDDDVQQETLCPGVDYATDDFGSCSVSVLSSSSFRIQCAETMSSPEVDCELTISFDITFVFEGEGFTGSGPFSTATSGSDCPPSGYDDHGTIEITGERISDVPPGGCAKSDGSTLMRIVPCGIWTH